ncbi:MAG: hypothetical protein ABR924_07275 [Terracidiphilus sp.]|jgi:hypothetical protein
MPAPLRGTQSLVGQMGWVFARPSLTAIEVAWRWVFGIPFLFVCWTQAQRILIVLPPESAGLNAIDAQNPWVATVQLAHAGALYRPHASHVLRWLLPLAALAWVVVSGLGRVLVLKRLGANPEASPNANPGPQPPRRPPGLRILPMIALQTAWLALFLATTWGWFCSMQWAADTHIAVAGEPDLVGFSIWAIFLSLGFFTAWAVVCGPVAIAPILMLLEERSALSSLGQSLRLGKAFTGKLVEINLVMGIVKLALLVLAMVLSAAPLPFSDQLGSDTLHWITAAAAIFYLVASDYFQVVRLKGFIEFWKMFCGQQGSQPVG